MGNKNTSGDKATNKKNNCTQIGEVEFVDNELFHTRNAEKTLWGPDTEDIPVGKYRLLPQVQKRKSTPDVKRTKLTKDQEKTLFLRYNYAKYRLALVLTDNSLKGRKHRRARLTWKRRSRTSRHKLVHANLPLVPAMAQKSNVSNVEFTELMSEGYMAILRSIEKFDISKGFKFSTYACRAVISSFRRASSKAQTYRKHVPVQFDVPVERSDFTERRHDEQLDSAMEDIRRILQGNAAELSEVEFEILQQRFPILANEKPRTLAQVGKAVGLSNERVRQIEKASLSKIRQAMQLAE
ncbi:MAG: sigma-70 family RNA polymerase sigma factor [Phycisphaerae bacterium]